jgi:hypothetical protein
MALCAPVNPGAVWFQTDTLDSYWWDGAVWQGMGGGGGVLADHDHAGVPGDGGQLDWDNIWSDAVHSHSAAGEGGTLDWDSIWSDAVHDHSSAAEGGTFDAANLTSGASGDGEVLTSDGVGGAAWEVCGSGTNLGWFNVKDYGATGNGIADDTAAINLAVAALVAAGNGVLYFPSGTYLTSGGFVLSVPSLVMGAGPLSNLNGYYGSTVLCNSKTNTLFTTSAISGAFRDISLINITATPTTSMGIAVTHGAVIPKVDFDHIFIKGFYINIDSQTNVYWSMRGSWLDGAVKYGLKIRDLVDDDAGDCAIASSVISGHVYTADAGIRIESGGGVKITNTKIIGTLVHGVDLVPAAGVLTSQLMMTNCSIEEITGNGINIVSTGGAIWNYIILSGLQFGLYANITGYCILINSDTLTKINCVIITDNILESNGTAHEAVSFTKINNAYLGGNVIDGFTGLLTQAGCTNIVIGSSGDVATDPIWDSVGDLAVGTGPNTASRLSVGIDGRYLKADSGEATGLIWDVLSDHGHAGIAGDGGSFDVAVLNSGASSDGDVPTSDGAGGVTWEPGTTSGQYRQFLYVLDGAGDFIFMIDVDGNPLMGLLNLE